MPTITGEFEVKMTAQSSEAESPTLGRMVLDKQFHGPLQARSAGQMLAVHGSVSGSAAYVAMEVVTGTLEGRTGTFALVHQGLMERGKPSLAVMVVPDSGTGELAGLTGRLAIRIEAGKHCYDFDYDWLHS